MAWDGGGAVSGNGEGNDSTGEETSEPGTGTENAQGKKGKPPAARWGIAGVLLFYAGAGGYCIASAVGYHPAGAKPEGVTRSVTTALAPATAAQQRDVSTTDGVDVTRAIAAAKAYAARSYARAVASVEVAEPPVQVLTAVGAAAVGPQGPGDGDHPQLAQYVLDPRAEKSWISHWYASAHFGALKDGTGLLLDMGRTVTVRQVKLSLARSFSGGGADVEIRVGSMPNLENVAPAAVANDVGGLVSPRFRWPATGRYVQIWFTRLPRNSSGTYQEHVYGISLRGSAPLPPATAPGAPASVAARHDGHAVPGGRAFAAGHGSHAGGGQAGGGEGHDGRDDHRAGGKSGRGGYGHR
jgi:hypothetical protein